MASASQERPLVGGLAALITPSPSLAFADA